MPSSLAFDLCYCLTAYAVARATAGCQMLPLPHSPRAKIAPLGITTVTLSFCCSVSRVLSVFSSSFFIVYMYDRFCRRLG